MTELCPGSPRHPSIHAEASGAATAVASDRLSSVKETAIMAALRRNAKEKCARDAKRARPVERAREAREPWGLNQPRKLTGGGGEEGQGWHRNLLMG